MTTLSDLYQYFCRRSGCKANSKLVSHLDDLYASNGGKREADILDVSQNYVGAKGIIAVSLLAKNLYTLTELDFRHNGVEHEQCEESVLALAGHPSLKRINFSFNKLHDSSTPILEHLIKATPSLTEVRLDGNEFSASHLARLESLLNLNRAALLEAEAAASNEAAPEAKPPRYTPYRSEVSGVLTKENSGGHFHYATWRKNPQYALYLSREASTTITLKVPAPQATRTVGFAILKPQSLLKRIDYTVEDIVAESTFHEASTFVQVTLKPCDRSQNAAPYIVIPFTFTPGRSVEFQLIAEIDPTLCRDGAIVSLEEVDRQRDWCLHQVEGSWMDDNAAGDLSQPSWTRNDFYRVKYHGPVSRGVAQLFVLLTKSNDCDDNDQREIGFYILKPDTLGRPPVRLAPDTVLGSVKHQRQTSVGHWLEISCAAIDFIIVPTTSKPRQKGNYSLQIFSTCNLEVYQSLFPHGWYYRSILGQWDDQRDGGSRVDNPTTWIHNPCYELVVESNPEKPNHTVDIFLQLERSSFYIEETAQSITESLALRKYTEQATQDIGIMITNSQGELPVVASTRAWSNGRTAELYVNELPPGSYFVVPYSRRAGHRDEFELQVKSSSVVALSEDIPLARRLRERQLQRYAEENEARRKEAAGGMTSPTASAGKSSDVVRLHPYDEDSDVAAKYRDQITERYSVTGELFIDRDFPRAQSSLWLDPDRPPRHANANVVEWRRPEEIVLAPKSNQSLEEGKPTTVEVVEPVFLPQGEVEGADIGGGLASEWFHGAAAAISTRSDWLSRIVGSYFPEYGFMQFRFFKNGRWTTVTIDNYLPVDALGELCFSRGIKSVDLFVPFIEKAWAKLHRCYEALDAKADAIPEALISLSGGICDTQALQTEEGKEWAAKNIWKELKLCREKHQILSLVLRRDSPNSDDKQHAGLYFDRLYAVLDCRDVEGKKLIKLHNFWGTAKAWKGKWAPESPNWTSTLKQAVDYTPSASTIWMSLDEVKYYFSQLYTTKLPNSSAWAQASFAANQPGGDLQRPTWVSNPQFALTVHADRAVKVIVGIHHPDARMTLIRAEGAKPEYLSEMGIVAIRTDDASRRLMAITAKEMPTTSPIANQRDIVLEIEVDPSKGHKYILMPFTLTMNRAASCYISASSMDPVPLSLKLIETDRNVSVEGEWKGTSAGGPRNYGSWRNNPQFLLYPSESTQVTVVLKQRNALNDTSAHIGFTVLKAHDIRRVLHPNPQDIVLEVAHDNDHAVVGNVHVDGVRERLGMPYVIVPSTSAPHLETGFTLDVVSNKRVQVKPIDSAFDWKTATIQGGFSFTEGTTGGSFKYSSWRNNPQYVLDFPTEKSGSLLIVLTKKNMADKVNDLGLAVLKADSWGKGRMRKVLCNPQDIISETITTHPSENSVELRLDYQVRREPLILMAHTVAPLCELDYELSFYCSSDITVTPVQEWKTNAVEGNWQPGLTAGGVREQNRSWINNPFYCLSLTRPTRVIIVALQYPKGPEKPVVKKVGKHRAFLPPPIVNEKNKVCFGFDVCHQDSLQTNIHSSRHTYEGEVTAMMEMPACDKNPYVIVPHTYDPEQEADFKILVFADEPFELYFHEKARRFY